MNFLGQLSILFLSLPLIQCTSEQTTKTSENLEINSEPETAFGDTLVTTLPGTSSVSYELDGHTVMVYDFEELEPIFNYRNDKVYVINFWATWCKPCVLELPAFYELHEKYQDKGVEVILVSMDFKSQIESELLPFIIENDIKPEIPVLSDPDANSWIPKIDKDWSGAIPATLIYSKDKRAFFETSFTFIDLEKEVKIFLN